MIAGLLRLPGKCHAAGAFGCYVGHFVICLLPAILSRVLCRDLDQLCAGHQQPPSQYFFCCFLVSSNTPCTYGLHSLLALASAASSHGTSVVYASHSDFLRKSS